MKETQRCPKCERQGRPGTNLVHIRNIDDATYGGYAPQALTHKGVLFGGQRHGLVEAFVCNDCGYVEYYIADYPLPPTETKHD